MFKINTFKCKQHWCLVFCFNFKHFSSEERNTQLYNFFDHFPCPSNVSRSARSSSTRRQPGWRVGSIHIFTTSHLGREDGIVCTHTPRAGAVQTKFYLYGQSSCRIGHLPSIPHRHPAALFDTFTRCAPIYTQRHNFSPAARFHFQPRVFNGARKAYEACNGVLPFLGST